MDFVTTNLQLYIVFVNCNNLDNIIFFFYFFFWNILCEHGVSIAMSENVDVKYIQQASNELKQTTNNLKSATNNLKSKLASFNIIC